MKNKRYFIRIIICIMILIETAFLVNIGSSNHTCYAAAINNYGKPTSIKSMTSTKNSIQIVWKKISSCKGYQIQYASDELFTYSLGEKYITDASKTTYTIKNLLEKRTYFIRIRTYNVTNNKKVYSTWCKVKSVKTKDDKSTNEDQEVATRIKTVVNEITSKDMSVPEKLLALYDWMVTYIDYDQSLNDTTIYKAVMEGSGICTSYAASVQLYCDEMGIPCKTYTGYVGYGTARCGHAWNVVKVNGKWYIYDVTLGDSFYGDSMGNAKKYGWNNYPDKFLVPYDYTTEWNASLEEYYHHDSAFPKPAGKDTKYVEWAIKKVRERISKQIATQYKEKGYQVFLTDAITEEVAFDIAMNKYEKVAFISNCFNESLEHINDYLGSELQSMVMIKREIISPSYCIWVYTYAIK